MCPEPVEGHSGFDKLSPHALPVCWVPAPWTLKPRRRAGLRPGTFADMSPGRDEDLDWLYGRDPQQAEPERTRVMPDPYGSAAPDAQQRRAPYPPPTPTGHRKIGRASCRERV